MSKLVIVESPAKAKNIKGYLGRGYDVIASMGHVRDLPAARLSVDIANDFEPKYAVIKGKENFVKDLKKKADNADYVYLATDPDREGEAISWHLATLLGLDLKVGTRKASEYAIKAAHIMAKGITEAGALVVSGGALGIDTYSHLGALACGGKTVAVLGNGLGNNYLKANEGLRNMIKQSGALVTEYQPNVPANRTSFPMRNRIISGLSLGILVVEAGVKSGSLITANLAIEQNRDVYAVPASIFSSDFSGTNKLISDGARLAINPVNVVEAYENDYPTLDLSKIRTANEIVLDNSEKTLDTSIVKKKSAKELNVKPTPENNLIDKKYSFENLEKGRENRRKIDENVWSLEGNNKIVYDCIGEEFTQVDDIIEKSGLTASQVLVALTFLELKKVIISASGKRFKKS